MEEPQIFFNFWDGVDLKEKANVLKRIQSWKDVKWAKHVWPKSKNDPFLGRVCQVQLKNSSRNEQLLAKIRKIKGVSSAYIPPPRQLFDNVR